MLLKSPMQERPAKCIWMSFVEIANTCGSVEWSEIGCLVAKIEKGEQLKALHTGTRRQRVSQQVHAQAAAKQSRENPLEMASLFLIC